MSQSSHPSDDKIKIIVTDDQKLFRNGVQMALKEKQNIEIIAEAENGQQLLEKLETLKPEIIILNISMPVLNGPETLPILKKKYPGIKVIILSMFNNPEMICQMMWHGASAYITKESGAGRIYETILAVHRSWLYINDTVQDAFEKARHGYDPNYHLTDDEKKIISLLKEENTIHEIARKVFLYPMTVQSVIDKLKSRYGVKSNTLLIQKCVLHKQIE